MEIARRREAQVYFASAFEPTMIPPAARGFVNQEELHEHQRKDVETYLQSQLPSDYDKCEAVVLQGPAAEGVLDFAAEKDVELSVLTTRGASGLGNWLFGSVAERISRHSPCPVLTIGLKTLSKLEAKLEQEQKG